jgi:hypothetical protein
LTWSNSECDDENEMLEEDEQYHACNNRFGIWEEMRSRNSGKTKRDGEACTEDALFLTKE